MSSDTGGGAFLAEGYRYYIFDGVSGFAIYGDGIHDYFATRDMNGSDGSESMAVVFKTCVQMNFE